MTAAFTILSFDFGTKRIGVAVGQSITGTASPLAGLSARDGIPNWDDIERLIQEWKPHALVVGVPLNMDDSESEMSQRARKFARRLHGRYGLPVHELDERLSSFAARGIVLDNVRRETPGKRQRAQQPIDSVAAVLIAETWLSSHPPEH